jgi:hypothetical protein
MGQSKTLLFKSPTVSESNSPVPKFSSDPVSMPIGGPWVDMYAQAPVIKLKGKLMKQGLVFENCRITTLDSNGILRYTAVGKKDVRATIDLKSAGTSVRFLYIQKKEGKINNAN